MSDIKRVGLIGLGAMGRPMARHLIDRGFEVCGYDPADAAQQKAMLLGVPLESSPADVARDSEIVIVVVGFDADVEKVFFAKGGLMEAARPGLIVAIGSTIAPSYARELAERVEGSGLVLIDMPLTRGEWAAEAAQMLVLGGGEEHAFERCKPVFATFASDVFHLGPFGAGQVGKMVNNMMLWACMSATDEGLRLADKMGVDREKLRHALGHSSAQNWSMTTRAEEKPTPWAEKDMLIAMQEADNVRMPLPLSGVVRELIKDFKVRMNYPTPKVPK
jgi:3-hydroxyisobutyrate dehydrogenase-like beta-hydroxyacid dehydrogenase